MTQITKSEDCRNSPKNAFMQEVTIGLFVGDKGEFRAALADDVVLRLGDRPSVIGADLVETLAEKRLRERFDAIVIHHAITHGRVGAANGVATKGATETPFAVVAEFATLKADRIAALNLYGL